MISWEWLFFDWLVYLNLGSFFVIRLLLYLAYFFVFEILSWINKVGDFKVDVFIVKQCQIKCLLLSFDMS